MKKLNASIRRAQDTERRLEVDDIETPDMVTTPEVSSKLKNMFDVSQILSDKDARFSVVSTPYHYDDLIQLLNKRH